MTTAKNSRSKDSRRRIKMTRQPLSTGARTLMLSLLFTGIGLAWVWKMSWSEQTSNRMLALELQETEFKNEWGNLQAELSGLSRYTRVESDARTRLGMVFPTAPPDTIWSEVPVEKPSLGSLPFLSPIPSRERKLSRSR